MKIKDVIKGKSSQAVVTIGPEATVRELVALLAEHNVGALVVSEDGERVAGIVSERDVVRRLHGHDEVLGTAVAEIMTSDVHTVQPDHDLDSTRRAMTDRRIRHVPIVEDGTLRAIVSIGDVVKQRINDLRSERDQLASYINQ